MEEDEYSWSEALIKSYQMMKGRLLTVLALYLSYGSKYILYWIVSGTIVIIFGSINEILMLICLVFSLFFYIEAVKGKIEIAKYLLYKEFLKEEVNDE